MAKHHLDDLAKVLRGVFLVASRAAESRTVASSWRYPPSQAYAASQRAAQAAEPAPAAAAPPPPVTPPQPSASPSPAAADRAEEPQIHGLQGVHIFKEETSEGVVMDEGAAGPASSPQQPAPSTPQAPQPRKFVPRERAVPANPISRALGFAGLGASLLLGSAKDSVSRAWRGSAVQAQNQGQGGGKEGSEGQPNVYSSFLSESNAERLAEALCRMRGAALKLGQMLSIQDETVMPPAFQAALERVRAGADVMPRRQLEGQLSAELGPDWRSKLATFDDAPMAAASIGQVHSATLHDGRRVVMKVQYPGVARSIESDVDNLMRLISVANLLPRGMYVENAVAVAKRELALECDYRYEAAAQQRFATLITQQPGFSKWFSVPGVVSELCAERVLTTEWAPGVHIDRVAEMDQATRDAVGTRLMALTLTELYDWGYMQTDPNWGNFLYDPPTDTIHLIDFGAAKEYPDSFVDEYLEMVRACAERDAPGIVRHSTAMGFLTGDESKVMLDAHCEAAVVVGTPFAAEGAYDFGSHGAMTKRVTELGAVMLKHRLTPPPEEVYSLHRKLSGAFLACIKLRARVPARRLFYELYEKRQARRAGAVRAAATAATA